MSSILGGKVRRRRRIKGKETPFVRVMCELLVLRVCRLIPEAR